MKTENIFGNQNKLKLTVHKSYDFSSKNAPTTVSLTPPIEYSFRFLNFANAQMRVVRSRDPTARSLWRRKDTLMVT